MASASLPEQPWARSAAEVLRQLDVDASTGLATAGVAERRAVLGSNALVQENSKPWLFIFFRQFRGVVVYLLIAAALLAFAMADAAEGIAIIVVIAINAMLGFVTELRATRSMEALRRMAQVDAVVLRDGERRVIPAADLVPGDILDLEAGDLLPADARIVRAAKLQVDESTLTGESLPVSKQVDAVAEDATLFNRRNMAFRGTAVTRGHTRAVVTGVGSETEFGRIFESVKLAETQHTPLERRLDKLGERLVYAVGVIAVLVAAAGIATGRDIALAVEVSVALAVAAIPEGLPIVATIALARGMWRMARRNALITRLSAVETLGATDVIMTDKTGTLTENRMTMTRIIVGPERIVARETEGDWEDAEGRAVDARELRCFFRACVLCNNATLGPEDDKHVGDPTEIALMLAADAFGMTREEMSSRYPELAEDPFDPESKRMATVHRDDYDYLVAVKGAPEVILPLCTRQGEDAVPLDDAGRECFLSEATEMASSGLRTLALAQKRAAGEHEDPYSELSLLGIACLEDPEREGVADAIAACRKAGIEVVMMTGDHLATAQTIGERVGIEQVHARVKPEDKLRLIEECQQEGHIVAMTGDGVNDAPALKRADIGVAMGIRGTAVAREASAMVLQDDELRTIVAAVEQGRAIFENIRKFVVYLLSCNISEVLIVSLATLAGAPLPLLPLQILFLNLVTDVFPALALGAGDGSPHLMERPPRRRDETVLMRNHWLRIALHGSVLAAVVLASMATGMRLLGLDGDAAVTVSFCTLAFAQLWHVLNMRDDMASFFRNEITSNPWVWSALALCSLLVMAAVHFPGVSHALHLVPLPVEAWLLVFGMSVVPLLTAPLVRRLADRFARR